MGHGLTLRLWPTANFCAFRLSQLSSGKTNCIKCLQKRIKSWMFVCAHWVASNSDHERRKELRFIHYLGALWIVHYSLCILYHSYNKTLMQVQLYPTYRLRIQDSERLGLLTWGHLASWCQDWNSCPGPCGSRTFSTTLMYWVWWPSLLSLLK